MDRAVACAEIEGFRFLLWFRSFYLCTILLIIYLIPAMQTSDWRMFFTIAFIKSFKVPKLSLFAARETILLPFSLILIERQVLAFSQYNNSKQTDYKFITHLKDDNSAALQFCEMTYHFLFTILQLVFLYWAILVFLVLFSLTQFS